MKAIILAAGEGKRLYPFTSKSPKCMVKVYGKPILQYQIEAFRDAGIKQIIIVVGYRAEDVKNYLKSYDQTEIIFIENEDFSTTNNMYSLWLAKKELLCQGDFILCNGDVIFDKSIILRLMNSSANCIVCDKGKYNEESMKITIDSSGFVNDISKTISAKQAFGNSIDVYSFSEDIFKILFSEIEEIIKKEKELNKWNEVALQRVLQDKKFKMKPLTLVENERWVEIDCITDLLYADEIFSRLLYKIKNKKLFFLDLDGTVYVGDQLIPGTIDFISKLELAGKKCFFISNNSSKAKKDYVDKLRDMNIITDVSNIVLSSDGVKEFLKRKGVKNIFMVASNAMELDFLESGFNIDLKKPEFVVMGYDTDINYEKIRRAAIYLQNGVPFIATHGDIVCPSSEGPIPDIGSMIAMFEKATGITPVVFGKPRPEMVEHLINSYAGSKSEVLMIGDRLYTDMKLAENCGIDFVCVLSGETKREDIEALETSPDLVISRVSDLIPYLD